MRKRCCHSSGVMDSSSDLVLRALLLFIVSLLLLECGVRTEKVGHGGHLLVGNKITTLGKETRGTKCNFEMQGADIIVKYDNTMKGGCLLDLLALEVDTLVIDFGVKSKSGALSSCLKDASGNKDHLGDLNLLPFTFSLLDMVTRGTTTDTSTTCNSCSHPKGRCLKDVDYAVAFAMNGAKVRYIVSPIGEPKVWWCDDGGVTSDKQEASFTLKISLKDEGWSVDMQGCTSGLSSGGATPDCYRDVKSLQKPKLWKIESSTEAFKYLLTLHILDQKDVPKHKDGMKIDPVNKLDKGPLCDLYMKFGGTRYKLLGGDPTPVDPSGTGPGSNTTVPPGGSTDVGVGGEKASESSGPNMGLIIGAVVGVLLLVVGGVAVWFFVFRGKGEEEEGMEMGMTGAGGTTKTKGTTKVGGTTVGATQAKTGGMTTVGGTQAKTGMTTAGGATKGATSKAAGTTKGGAASKAGGATSKK